MPRTVVVEEGDLRTRTPEEVFAEDRDAIHAAFLNALSTVEEAKKRAEEALPDGIEFKPVLPELPEPSLEFLQFVREFEKGTGSRVVVRVAALPGTSS